MPYYTETFVNSYVRPFWTGFGSLRLGTVRESATVNSHRSRPHPSALQSVEDLTGISSDPYAYFLTSQSRAKYREALKARGVSQEIAGPDRGHAFSLVKHTIAGGEVNLNATGKTVVNGNLIAETGSYPGMLFNDTRFEPIPYKETGLAAFAQQSYNRTAPDSVEFDAAQFLGELREGLPSMLGASLLKENIKSARAAGSEYLNVEFGWKPLISDIKNAARALSGATQALAMSGKPVRRRMELPLESSNSSMSFNGTLTLSAGASGLLNAAQLGKLGLEPASVRTDAGYASVDYVQTRLRRRWFSGEFSSFMPLGFDPSDYMSRLNQLVNVKLTPSTLWELSPWSWLVDWGLRIGDTIEANQKNANDLLIMHYGYAMEETTYQVARSWRLTSPTGGWFPVPTRGSSLTRTVYKKRLRANPFGFKIGGQSALTGSQSAILGALGLTKTR